MYEIQAPTIYRNENRMLKIKYSVEGYFGPMNRLAEF